MSDDPIEAWMKRGLAEAAARVLDDAPEPQMDLPFPGGYENGKPVPTHPDPRRAVRKISSTIPISIDMAVEHGLVSEEDARAQGWTPHVYPPIPFWRRVRYRLRGWWDMRPRAHFGPCRHEDCG